MVKKKAASDTMDYTLRKLPRAVHTALKHMAADRETSIQDTMLDILSKAALKSGYYKPDKDKKDPA